MKNAITIVTAIFIMLTPALAYQSLQAIFDQAEGNGEYDKYIELNRGTEYHGDLAIPPGLDVYIDGNGAVIWGLDSHRDIQVLASRLDISECVIIGGNYGVYYDTMSTGSINNNTIVGCNYSGVATMYQDTNVGVEMWDNIIFESYLGLFCIEGMRPNYIGFNTIYGTESHRYGELCPS